MTHNKCGSEVKTSSVTTVKNEVKVRTELVIWCPTCALYVAEAECTNG